MVMMLKSVSQKILLIMLVIMLAPLLTVSIYWGYKYSNNVLYNEYMDQYMSNYDSAINLQNFLDSKFNSITALSFEYSNHQDLNTFTPQVKNILSSDNTIKELDLTDSYGNELLSVDNNLNPKTLSNISDTTAFKQTNIANINTYSGTVSYQNGTPIVELAVPLNTNPNSLAYIDLLNNNNRTITTSKANGMILIKVNLQSVLNSITNQSNSNNMQNMPGMNMSSGNNTNTVNNQVQLPDQHNYIVDSTGTVIASYDSSMIGKNLSNVSAVKAYISSLNSNDSSTYAGNLNVFEGYYTNNKNINAYTTVATLGGYGKWAVISETPRSTIIKPVIRFALINGVILFASILLIILIAFYITNLISKPIKKLVKAAQDIGIGNFDVDLDTHRKDEFGQLNNSLIETSQSLKTLISTTNEQSGELNAIIDNSKNPIISLDTDGGILISNKAAVDLLEVDQNKLHGMKLEEILRLTIGDKINSLDLKNMAEGSKLLENQTYISPTNQKHQLDISIIKLPTNGFVITKYILTITDKTKSVELDEMKLDFVSMAAHELRTPLTAIQGYLELMMFGDNAANFNDNNKRYIEQARVSTKELSELITKLLSVSRIEHGNFKLNWDKVDIAARVKEAVDSLQFNAKEKKVTLSMTGNIHDEFIVGDRYSVQEVINNLIDNAIKYNHESGNVNVTLYDDNSNYIITVKDSGIGIPKNAIPYLFTKFYRVHGGLESGSTGTGIGLYLAKQIIEQHRGTIDVQSEVGQGTSFIITLPHYSDTLMSLLTKNENNASKEDSNRAWNTKNINR